MYPWGEWPLPLPVPPDEATKQERGDDEYFDPADLCANTHELGLGGTSPVGIFPNGAADCDAEDLAGNVWEWCATPYQAYPLPADLVAETFDTISNGKTYVLRGGSWNSQRSYARCGARLRGGPDYRLDHLGFRVARLFSLP